MKAQEELVSLAQSKQFQYWRFNVQICIYIAIDKLQTPQTSLVLENLITKMLRQVFIVSAPPKINKTSQN